MSKEVENLGVPTGRISTIPNGVDLETFRLIPDLHEMRTKLSIEENDKVLLFIGRLAQVKRVEIIIALTKLLLKDGFNIKTIIVGDGPCRDYYEKLAEPIRSNVIFTGWLHRKQTFKYYHIADVFVLPSLSEGLPTVLLEASAAGKPSVASNVNGISDIVVHGETGYLVERLDINSYVQHVKTLLTDDDLARRMGARAAEYVKENFNWDVILDKYEKLYREIL
jgi:glycosyltransferase involved in cell wall biosynthesis